MVNQAVSKSGSSAGMWLQQHGDVLFGYAMARLRDRDAAEELVQETLVTAIDAHGRFAGESSERTWLIGILRNKLLEHYRQREKHARSTHDDPQELAAVVDREFTSKGYWIDGPGRWGRSLESVEQREAFRIALAECLAKLPARTAEAFMLAEREGLSAERVRNALAISSTNHVYVLLHRARSALRQCLERNWISRGDSGK